MQLPQLERREFIGLIAAATAWPLAARAQQTDTIRRIGILMDYRESDPEARAWVGEFEGGLRDHGWVQGRNVHIEKRRSTPGDAESIRRCTQELVALLPELVLSSNTPATAACCNRRAQSRFFALVADPVGSGFVASFPRPGGNITGFISNEPTMSGKWLELLKEIAPRVTKAAFLFNPQSGPHFEYYLDPLKA